jgi:sugar lactone lactonase YvrE
MSKVYTGFVVILSISLALLASHETDRKKDETSVHPLKLLKRFGGLDVPLEQSFDNPVDITVCKEGNIYVLDSNDNDIKVFDDDGIFIKSLCREGSGPGELKRPWILQLIGNRIYVVDANNRRIQILNGDGLYENGYKVPVKFGQGMAFDAQGNLSLSTQGLRSRNLVSVYDCQGNLIKEFGELEGKSFDFYDFTRIKDQIKKGNIPDMLKNDLLLIVDTKGCIIAVHTGLNKWKKYTPEGDLLFESEIEPEEYHDIYSEFREQNRKLESSPNIFHPLRYVNDLAMDQDGNLYILLNLSSRMVVLMFADDGTFKGKLGGIEDNIYRIAISPSNDLYALSRDTHFIYKFKLN